MSVTEYTYLTIWNMNGGPIPQEVMEDTSSAIEDVIKEAEKKYGVRLLHSIVNGASTEAA